jgi:hypothetical protein
MGEEPARERRRRKDPDYISSKAYPVKDKARDASEEPMPYSGDYPFGPSKRSRLYVLAAVVLVVAGYIVLNPSVILDLMNSIGSWGRENNSTLAMPVPVNRSVPYVLDYPEKNVYLPQHYEGTLNESSFSDPVRGLLSQGWDLIYVDLSELSMTNQSVRVLSLPSVEGSNATLSSGPYLRALWPYWADTSVCKDQEGVARSTKGRDSATFFALGDCPKEKSYYVSPSHPISFRIRTDSNSSGQCLYPDFVVFEYKNSSYVRTARFNFTSSPGLDVSQSYMSNSTSIKIYADRCFYLDVSQFY